MRPFLLPLLPPPLWALVAGLLLATAAAAEAPAPDGEHAADAGPAPDAPAVGEAPADEVPAEAVRVELPFLASDETNRVYLDLAPEGSVRPMRLLLDTDGAPSRAASSATSHGRSPSP